MCDKPTNGGVDRPVRRSVIIRSSWHAIGFVGHLGLPIHDLPPRPTGIDIDRGDQGQNNNETERAEDEDGYEPCPKALTHLKDRSSSHGWSSECVLEIRSGSCGYKRACGRYSKVPQKQR